MRKIISSAILASLSTLALAQKGPIAGSSTGTVVRPGATVQPVTPSTGSIAPTAIPGARAAINGTTAPSTSTTTGASVSNIEDSADVNVMDAATKAAIAESPAVAAIYDNAAKAIESTTSEDGAAARLLDFTNNTLPDFSDMSAKNTGARFVEQVADEATKLKNELGERQELQSIMDSQLEEVLGAERAAEAATECRLRAAG